MKQQDDTTPVIPDLGMLYTPAEVARALKVSSKTVRNWVRSHALPAFYYGRQIRVRQAEDVSEVLGPLRWLVQTHTDFCVFSLPT